MQQTSSFSPVPLTLPASSEHEWRFSYQFTASPSSVVARVMLGVGLVALTIVAVNAAW
ncbi:MAG TPA: hypothetical protein VFZ34_27140 [Blastocatellia bacterium]|nr:hypothetical protein [Blastocatellia bacterium]